MNLNQATSKALIAAIESATGKTIGRSAHVLGTSRKSLFRAKSEGMTPKRAARLAHAFNARPPDAASSHVYLTIELGGMSHVTWRVFNDGGYEDEGYVVFQV